MADVIAAAVARIEELVPAGQTVPIRTPLEADECEWFLRADAEGVVRFGECPPDCFRLKKWGASGPDHFETPAGKPRHLFSKPVGPEGWLNREYIPHLAAYARTILDFGYQPASSSFSLYRKYERDLLTKKAGGGYETDAEFYDADGRIHLQIEAKADAKQVAAITRQLDAGVSLAELPTKAVKEIEYVLDLSPRYLWIVGPGSVDPAPHVYEVTVTGLDAQFTKLGQFPEP